MDLQRKQREMSLINEENTQSIRQFKSTKLGSMPPSTAQQASYENIKANFFSITRVQYVRCGGNTKRNFARRGRPLMLGKIDLMVQNYMRVRFMLVVGSLFSFKKEK